MKVIVSSNRPPYLRTRVGHPPTGGWPTPVRATGWIGPPGAVLGCSSPARGRGPVVQFGVHAGLSSRRSRVQIPSGPPLSSSPLPSGDRRQHGWVAQLAERAPEKREVTGSTPVPATKRVRRAAISISAASLVRSSLGVQVRTRRSCASCLSARHSEQPPRPLIPALVDDLHVGSAAQGGALGGTRLDVDHVQRRQRTRSTPRSRIEGARVRRGRRSPRTGPIVITNASRRPVKCHGVTLRRRRRQHRRRAPAGVIRRGRARWPGAGVALGARHVEGDAIAPAQVGDARGPRTTRRPRRRRRLRRRESGCW